MVLLLSPNCCLTAGFFLPLLKYVITEALPASLIGLALGSGGSLLEPLALALSDMGKAARSFSQKPPL